MSRDLSCDTPGGMSHVKCHVPRHALCGSVEVHVRARLTAIWYVAVRSVCSCDGGVCVFCFMGRRGRGVWVCSFNGRRRVAVQSVLQQQQGRLNQR